MQEVDIPVVLSRVEKASRKTLHNIRLPHIHDIMYIEIRIDESYSGSKKMVQWEEGECL